MHRPCTDRISARHSLKQAQTLSRISGAPENGFRVVCHGCVLQGNGHRRSGRLCLQLAPKPAHRSCLRSPPCPGCVLPCAVWGIQEQPDVQQADGCSCPGAAGGVTAIGHRSGDSASRSWKVTTPGQPGDAGVVRGAPEQLSQVGLDALQGRAVHCMGHRLTVGHAVHGSHCTAISSAHPGSCRHGPVQLGLWTARRTVRSRRVPC